MALPEQVRQQSEAAARLIAELSETGGTPAEPVAVVVPPELPADSVTSVVPPAVVTEPLPAGDTPTENFEQKYKSLQGMFNAEVPKLNALLRERDDKLAQLESLMASLHTLPAPTAVPAQSQVTDAEKAEWGDSIEMMRKVSKAELHPVFMEIASLKTALNNLATSLNTSVLPQVRHVAQQQAVSATDQFWNTLQREIPNWQQTNNDADFQSWLLSVDDLTGHTRQSFLEQAQKALDVNRVIAFFRSYAAVSGKTIPSATPTLLAQPNGSASELELQLAPGRSRGGKPPASPTAKTYTQADISKFYDDVRKGLYRGREAERNQTEADIFAANKENRIVATA